MKCPENANLQRQSGCLGLGWDWEEHEIPVWSNRNDLREDCGDGCPQLYIDNLWIVHLKWVNFMACKLHFIKFQNKYVAQVLIS